MSFPNIDTQIFTLSNIKDELKRYKKDDFPITFGYIIYQGVTNTSIFLLDHSGGYSHSILIGYLVNSKYTKEGTNAHQVRSDITDHGLLTISQGNSGLEIEISGFAQELIPYILLFNLEERAKKARERFRNLLIKTLNQEVTIAFMNHACSYDLNLRKARSEGSLDRLEKNIEHENSSDPAFSISPFILE